MWSMILLGIGAYLLYFVSSAFLGFRRDLSKAKQSGIPYVVVPVYYLKTWWLVSHPLWLPLLAKLPRNWTQWVDFCIPDFYFRRSIEVFQQVGSDTFLVVAPGGTVMHTADPAVITQITTRRNDFPKPIPIYRSLDIYGKNVVSTEGPIWRQHRKATSPPFTEKNNHLVWTESLDQASAMLSSWVGPDGKGDITVDRVMDDTMRLSLYVISRAGFGKKLQWPSADAKADVDANYVDKSKIHNEESDRDRGHSMSYTYAIHCLLDNILFQFLVPRWLLRHFPSANFRKADEAYNEWGNYMREAVASKKKDLEASADETKDQMDLLAQLVKGQVASEKNKGNSKDVPLTDSEVLGNMFVLILAGHETAANSIHFSLLYLALYPKSQRATQKDLDRIFQGKPPSEWDYDRDLPALFGGMVGAVLAEELRLVPPVIGIPKSTWGVPDQPITIGGKACTVPAGVYISLASGNVHRNPKYWPTSKPSLPGGHTVHPIANLDNDLEEFHPERWLLDDTDEVPQTETANGKKEMPNETVTADDLAINEAADTSDKFYRPPKGAYVPFSDGYRACLGRRFAQVEVLATLAVILQNYSVELAVDQWATDEEVIAMDEDARVEVWEKAAERARKLMLTGLSVIISLQMRAGHVALRFVPRGQEKFPDDADERWKAKHPELCEGIRGTPGWRFWA
ncbi:putative P450 monooxygenase [Cladophialophora carrionii]|uniref:Putative P450 monooxygenase n=1 Tax=Cladophialophora carrionii TaxID=86049 RepID=A0A1C1CWT9_9EURO|nr:putative P450 monooxygenase [Cladophialophora carrionii]